MGHRPKNVQIIRCTHCIPTDTAGISFNAIQFHMTLLDSSAASYVSTKRPDGFKVSCSDSEGDRHSYRLSASITIRGGYSTMAI